MKKLVSLVLVAALAIGVFSGCSAVGESSDAAGESPAEQEVTVAITSTIDKLDPLFMSTTQMGVVFSNMGATFYGTDAYGKLVPDLGESVEKSEDGLTYTFKTRTVWFGLMVCRLLQSILSMALNERLAMGRTMPIPSVI